MRNDGLDGAKRKSVQKASTLASGDFMSGVMLRASRRSAGWWFCPVSSVTLRGKPGTEPHAASWCNHDMCAPQACSSPGSGGCGRGPAAELRTESPEESSVGKSGSADPGKHSKAPRADGCLPAGTDRPGAVCWSHACRNIVKSEKLVSWDWFWPLWKNSKSWL